MAFKRDPDEIGALWSKQGKKGPYFTGTIDGIGAVVVFSTQKRSDKAPDWRVLKSKPKEERTAQPDDDIQF